MAQDELEDANATPMDALTRPADAEAYLGTSDTLECLGTVAKHVGSHREVVRLFGAADGICQRIGAVRLQVHQAGYDASVDALREGMEDKDFDSAWAEGAALSTA